MSLMPDHLCQEWWHLLEVRLCFGLYLIDLDAQVAYDSSVDALGGSLLGGRFDCSDDYGGRFGCPCRF